MSILPQVIYTWYKSQKLILNTLSFDAYSIPSIHDKTKFYYIPLKVNTVFLYIILSINSPNSNFYLNAIGSLGVINGLIFFKIYPYPPSVAPIKLPFLSPFSLGRASNFLRTN